MYQPFVPLGFAILFVTVQVGAVLSIFIEVLEISLQFPASSHEIISTFSDLSFEKLVVLNTVLSLAAFAELAYCFHDLSDETFEFGYLYEL